MNNLQSTPRFFALLYCAAAILLGASAVSAQSEQISAYIQVDVAGTVYALPNTAIASTSEGREFTFEDDDVSLIVILSGDPSKKGGIEFRLKFKGRPFNTFVQLPNPSVLYAQNMRGEVIGIMSPPSLGANTMSTPTSRRLLAGSVIIIPQY